MKIGAKGIASTLTYNPSGETLKIMLDNTVAAFDVNKYLVVAA